MSSTDKTFKKMCNNPNDWRIGDLEAIAERYGVGTRKRGGSHVVFHHPSWLDILCVPARRPIKAIYIKKFVALIEMLENTHEEN